MLLFASAGLASAKIVLRCAPGEVIVCPRHALFLGEPVCHCATPVDDQIPMQCDDPKKIITCANPDWEHPTFLCTDPKDENEKGLSKMPEHWMQNHQVVNGRHDLTVAAREAPHRNRSESAAFPEIVAHTMHNPPCQTTSGCRCSAPGEKVTTHAEDEGPICN